MYRLKNRLRKLEARIDVEPSWVDYFAQAEGQARTLLSPADRDLVAEATQLRKERGPDAWTEMHRSVWKRWNSAFDKAVVELRIPYSMHLYDAWL